jgi:hypothetical protein
MSKMRKMTIIPGSSRFGSDCPCLYHCTVQNKQLL